MNLSQTKLYLDGTCSFLTDLVLNNASVSRVCSKFLDQLLGVSAHTSKIKAIMLRF